jgi:hypothetical protein
MVVAREAIVINVGAEPPKYERVEVTDRKTGQRVMINKDEPFDPGDEGVPYSFKAFQKVSASHPAVAANPSAFLPIEDVDEELIVSGP